MQCLTSACEPMIGIFCRQLAEFFWEQRFFKFLFQTLSLDFQTLLHWHLLGSWDFLPKLRPQKNTTNLLFFASQSLLSSISLFFLFFSVISKMPTVPSLTPTRVLCCLRNVSVFVDFFFFSGITIAANDKHCSSSWLFWNTLCAINQTGLHYGDGCWEASPRRLGIPWVHVE